MAGSSAGSVFVDLLLKDANFRDGLNRSKRQAKSSFGSIKKDGSDSAKAIQAAFLGVTGVVGALGAGSLFARFIANTKAAEQEQAQLAAVLRSTGNAAGYSITQLNAMSDALSRNSVFSGGEITNAQTRLLSYSGILSENIPRAMQIVIDQSARLGISLENSAETIGRALESPTKAAAALSRQGFGAAFTKEVQDMIKALEQQGRVAEAQAVVMNILEESYEGAAKAARDTLAGSLTGLNNSIDALLSSKNGFPALKEVLNQTSDFILDISKDSNVLETSLYGMASAVLSLYENWNRFALSNAERTNFFGLRDEAVNKYRENIEKAIAAQERLGQELLDRKIPNNPDEEYQLNTIPVPSNVPEYIDPKKAARDQQKAINELNSLYNQHRGLIQGVDSATLKYRDTIEDLNKLLETGKITQEEYNGAIYRAQEEFDKAREKGTQFAFDVEAATKRAAENIQDSFADFLFDPFDKGLKGMAKGFIDTIRRMIAEAQSAQILGALFGNNSNSGFGQLLGSLTGGTDSSGISWDQPFSFGSFGGMFDGFFADGGYISPGHFGVAGEAGAELIYGGKTGATVFNQDQVGRGNVYNIDARGADQAAVNRLEQSLLTLAGPGVIEQRVGNAQMRGAL